MCVYIAERMYYCLITHVRMCKRDGGWDGGCGGAVGGWGEGANGGRMWSNWTRANEALLTIFLSFSLSLRHKCAYTLYSVCV